MRIEEILAALIDEEGLTLQATAARVRAAGAPNVKYQHLQHLLNGGKRPPVFLPQLAKAFGMSTEEFLAWRPGHPRATTSTHYVNGTGDTPPSQAVQPEPEILASSYQLVRLAHRAMELAFDPEDVNDARIILLAYNYLAARAERNVTPDNLVDFTEYLRKRRTAQGSYEEGSSSTRSTRGRARRQGA